MKKIVWIMSCLCIVLWGTMCQASQRTLLDNPRIAVLNFQNKGIVDKNFDRAELISVSDYAYETLLDAGRFELVERNRLREITDELALGNTGLVADPNMPGQLKAADFLLMGSINAVTTRKAETSVVGAGTERFQVTASISMRLVDVETGQVAMAVAGRGKVKNRLVKAPLKIIRIGTAELDSRLLDDALRAAIDDAINGPRGMIAKMEGRAAAPGRKR